MATFINASRASSKCCDAKKLLSPDLEVAIPDGRRRLKDVVREEFLSLQGALDMVRTLCVAVMLGTVSGSLAFAAGAPQVTVTITGKQPQEVHAELVKASNRVCSELTDYGSLDAYGADRLDCIHDTLSQAMLTVNKIQATKAMFAQNTARRNSGE